MLTVTPGPLSTIAMSSNCIRTWYTNTEKDTESLTLAIHTRLISVQSLGYNFGTWVEILQYQLLRLYLKLKPSRHITKDWNTNKSGESQIIIKTRRSYTIKHSEKERTMEGVKDWKCCLCDTCYPLQISRDLKKNPNSEAVYFTGIKKWGASFVEGQKNIKLTRNSAFWQPSWAALHFTLALPSFNIPVPWDLAKSAS